MKNQSLTYADAGVDIGAWNSTRDKIGRMVASTFTPPVVGNFGQFGGLFDLSQLKEYDNPVLVSSVYGVGTKLKIAFEMNIHSTVGVDIVNHCINDILVLGAQPLFFLDYIGTGRLLPDVAASIVSGLCNACRNAKVALIGGETAEMPGFYAENEYDISGTIVGIVDREKILDGSALQPGDVLIGLRSNGLHTNGYSLARKIITEAAGKSYFDPFENTTFGEELLRPHCSYLPVLPLLRSGAVKGCAHITGGGFPDNVARILPKTVDALISTASWTPHSIFSYLEKEGNVTPAEMYHTFNMGVGLVLVVAAEKASQVLSSAECEMYSPVCIGTLRSGHGKVQMELPGD